MLKLIIPPPVYMLMFATAMWFLNDYLPLTQLVPPPWNKLGFVVMIGAFTLDLSSLLLFFKRHTSINPISPKNATSLVTTGIYKYTRNPMYVGLTILLTGWAIKLGSLSPFLLIPLFVIVLTIQQIIPEEKVLEELFGEEYLEYKKKVNRWL